LDAEFGGLVESTRGLQPWRRVFHAASGVVLALAPGAVGLSWERTAALLAGLTIALFALDFVRLKVPGWNRLFFRLLSPLASPREADGVASSSWFAFAATLLWGLVPGPPALAGLLVLGLADPAASVVGRTWGRRPLGKGTWEGSAAFVVVALGVLSIVVGLPGALLVAVVAAAAEVIPSGLDDNLTVPLSTAAAVWAFAAPPAGGLLG
jgi:dolichol kinase